MKRKSLSEDSIQSQPEGTYLLHFIQTTRSLNGYAHASHYYYNFHFIETDITRNKKKVPNTTTYYSSCGLSLKSQPPLLFMIKYSTSFNNNKNLPV